MGKVAQSVTFSSPLLPSFLRGLVDKTLDLGGQAGLFEVQVLGKTKCIFTPIKYI